MFVLAAVSTLCGALIDSGIGPRVLAFATGSQSSCRPSPGHTRSGCGAARPKPALVSPKKRRGKPQGRPNHAGSVELWPWESPARLATKGPSSEDRVRTGDNQRALDSGRDHPRLEHGVHRRHRRERRPARAAIGPRSHHQPTCSGWWNPTPCFLAALLLTGGSLGDRYGRRKSLRWPASCCSPRPRPGADLRRTSSN